MKIKRCVILFLIALMTVVTVSAALPVGAQSYPANTYTPIYYHAGQTYTYTPTQYSYSNTHYDVGTGSSPHYERANGGTATALYISYPHTANSNTAFVGMYWTLHGVTPTAAKTVTIREKVSYTLVATGSGRAIFDTYGGRLDDPTTLMVLESMNIADAAHSVKTVTTTYTFTRSLSDMFGYDYNGYIIAGIQADNYNGNGNGAGYSYGTVNVQSISLTFNN